MKCPKCGFTSFDGLANCKKCGTDLQGARRRLALGGRRKHLVPSASSDLTGSEPEDKEGNGGVDGFVELDLDLSFEDGCEEASQGPLFGVETDELPDVSTRHEPLMETSAGDAFFFPEREDDAEEGNALSDGEEAAKGDVAHDVFPRLLAVALDLGLVALLVGVFVLCGRLALDESAKEVFSQALLPPYALVALTVSFVYFTYFHYLTGQTPGKSVFGLIVVGEGGAPLSISQAFLRSCGGVLSLIALGLGFLPVLRRSDGRSWSDLLAGSRVVGVRKGSPGGGHDGGTS